MAYSDQQSEDLVLYCGDGRFGGPIESFIRGGLGLTRCARLVAPGGAVCLAGPADPFYTQDSGTAAQFFFLVDALRIKRVHFVAHDRCAFYMQGLNATPETLRTRQIDDLKKVIARLKHERPHLHVDSWIAELRNDAVAFIPALPMAAKVRPMVVTPNNVAAERG